VKDGPGRLLAIGYLILALAATGRSVFQIATKFSDAPFAYTLSAIAAVHYFLAVLAIARRWRSFAIAVMVFELIGVLSVGFLTVLIPSLFHANSVWSYFGAGYGFLPLVLPLLGLWWVQGVRR
jgi:hypothetical protein